MGKGDVLGDNRIEDVQWLFSLSEPELDMLISLKNMVLRRAKVVGHESLAKKFDLKMIRALGFILMEHLKGQLNDESVIPRLMESMSFVDRCNLLNCNLNGSFGTISTEEIRACVGDNRRKRIAELFCEDEAPEQKKANGERSS